MQLKKWLGQLKGALGRIIHYMTLKDWLKIVIMPILLLALTVVFANLIGIRLQDRSFRKNEVFKADLASIEEARQEAISIQKDIERVRRQIRQNEADIQRELENTKRTGTPEELREDIKHYCNGQFMEQSLPTLREAVVRVNSLKEYAGQSEGKTEVDNALADLDAKLLAYIECVDAKDCRICNAGSTDLGQGVLDSLKGVISAYKRAQDKLGEKYN